ncbi:MAG: transglutaminase domain-containing protein [Planctomycetaceae bacterium]|nr:transglutaminase domain-containing protein [Planctomycetaceae bacterium]
MIRQSLWTSCQTSPQRLCAAGLVALQALLLWKLMSGGPFALAAVVLAFTGATATPRRMLPKYDLARWSLILVIVFLVKSRFLPHEIGAMDGFVYSQYAYEIACALISIQLLILWGNEYSTRMPVLTLAIAGVCLVFLGDSRVTNSERILTSVVSGAYCALAVLYAAWTRTDISTGPPALSRLRTFMWVGPVIAGSLLGQASGLWLFRNEQQLELLLARLIESSETKTKGGFSGHVTLTSSSWQTEQDETVALQISGTSQTQYLKGQCLNKFHRSQWLITFETTSLTPTLSGSLRAYENPGMRAYSLTPDQDRPVTQVLDVWPQPTDKSTHLFLPEGALAVVVEETDLSRDRIGNIYRHESGSDQHYRVLLTSPQTTQQLSNEERGLFLGVPRRLDDRVEQITAEVFEGCTNTRQRIDRIESFFRDNYQYHLGIEVPPGEDPLSWFLANRIPAHCEYFATATAIMLRLEGIPTRLATGYVAAEWNPTAQLLIARHKDAHAWVEAYDDDSGQWVIVESTPSAGTPQPRTTNRIEAWRLSLKHQFARFLEAAMQWLRQDKTTFVLTWISGLLALLAAGGMVYYFRPHWLSLFAVDPAAALIPAALHRERRRLDRRLARLGLERGRTETPHQFAERIERTIPDDWGRRAARCYRLYARLRFDSKLDTPDAQLLELSRLRKFL